MWLWLATLARAADGCAPDDVLRGALQAWLTGDEAGATAALDQATAAFGCAGPVDPQTIARYWLIEGAMLEGRGDHDAALDDFGGARRVAPDLWLPDLGPALRAVWAGASAPSGVGRVVLDPAPGTRPVWVDGAPYSGGEVAAGLHLVQVGDGTGPAVYAHVVWVGAGQSAVVSTGLAPPSRPDPVPVPPNPPSVASKAVAARLRVATGAGAAFGAPLDHAGHSEPAVKVAIPVELAADLVGGRAFGRVQLATGVLAGGRYLATTPGGPIAMPVHLDAALGAGYAGHLVDLGLVGGASWPSRLTGRLFLDLRPVEHLAIELRGGANLPTERALEPAGELLVGAYW